MSILKKKINLIWLFIFLTPIFYFLILSNSYSKLTQFMVLDLAAVSFVTLAILQHFIDKNLKIEVVLEYVLIAALALIILQGFL